MKGFKKYLLTLLISVSIFLVGVNYVNAEGTAGEILLTKTATKEDKEKGRSADVTLTVNANGFTTVDKTDVVLVLDRSTSMDGTSMENTKEAAKDLVNLLITDKTKDNTRAAIVTYGSDLLTSYTSNSLTNNATALKNTINSIPNSMDNQGTNVHAGLIKTEELLKNSGDDTQKIVILLSDGEPTYYIGTDNKRHGMGGSDNYENNYCEGYYFFGIFNAKNVDDILDEITLKMLPYRVEPTLKKLSIYAPFAFVNFDKSDLLLSKIFVIPILFKSFFKSNS